VPELLGIARALHVAMSLSLFGTFLFRVAVAPAAIQRTPADAARRLGKRLDLLAISSLVAALVSAAGWLLLQTTAMSGARSFSATGQAIGPALLQTQFGHVLILRVSLLLAAALCLRPRIGHRRWAMLTGTFVSGAAVLLLAGSGHAAAIEGADRLGSIVAQAAHLAAAGAWLGGLAPLAFTLALPPSAAILAARRFSPLGIGCVMVLAVTAWLNAQTWIGSVPALVGTLYGRWALAKLALFAAMVALAATNRYRLTPSLASKNADAAAGHLRLSVAAEIALGLAVTMVAGMLATTPPGVHDQPWWPFAFRLSFAALIAALEEQPELYRTLSLSVIASAGGVLLALAGILYRRWRWPTLAAGLVLIVSTAPSFRAFVVDAFPTTFWRSPTGYSAQSLARGAQLYAAHCSACHGPKSRGDGPLAANLAAKPAELTAGRASDGDLFWWISHGLPDRGMPGFANTLDETARWSLIDFMRANADATRLAAVPSRPVLAPDFAAECPDGGVWSLRDLVGRVVHLVFVGPGSAARLRRLADIESFRRSGGVMTVVVARDAPNSMIEPFCTAITPEIADAYALFRDDGHTGASAIDGTEFLVDGAGAMRAMRRPGDKLDWVDLLAASDIDKFVPPAAAPQSQAQH
jgi:putative copper export protein/mono/diheme cytochrome c family protein